MANGRGSLPVNEIKQIIIRLSSMTKWHELNNFVEPYANAFQISASEGLEDVDQRRLYRV